MNEKIIIIDFGSQYTQLIARKIRELNIYSEIYPYNNLPEMDDTIKGIILSGSPFSVNSPDAPRIDINSLPKDIPVLGICYGAQYIVNSFGGTVSISEKREYGRANLKYVDTDSPLLENINVHSQVWMSHGDTITHLPEGFIIIASTMDINIAAYKSETGPFWGLQFHPEVYHTTEGKNILRNFVVNICKCAQRWTAQSFISSTVEKLQQQIANDKVIIGVSGGVDSSVAAVLLHKAIADNLFCVFINNGLLRKDEYQEVLQIYQDELKLNIIAIDAEKDFLEALKGVTDPEQKRKIIGKKFIEIFENKARELTDIKWLAQGTIYPDIIESRSVKGPSSTIKSHHNVGGLPEKMNLKIVEPLCLLFKDEVRRVGKNLGINEKIIKRHPFPGPGLAIRILGEVTPERVKKLQAVDYIYIKILKESGWYEKIWQAGAILLPVRSVGVMGDERTFENVVALRAITSTDGMTADWADLPYKLLSKISNKIINNVKGVNRVVYDISSKPPATIEWE